MVEVVMKRETNAKYTIAWFKLAECVSRGEKERALGVYRLLSHSFDDQAYAQQLEADLLLAFKDQENAIEKYKLAAKWYKKEGRKFEAAAVYEHLRTLQPKESSYRTQLVDLYTALNITSKVQALQKQ
jgi:hypothetical protein